MKKRMTALLVVLMMVLSAFSGCAKTTAGEKLDYDSVVLKVGDDEITLREAYFIMKWRQAEYQAMGTSLYGAEWYNQDLTGTGTFIDYIKDSVIEDLETMYILAANAEAYGVSLSDDDKAEIETVVSEYMASNTEEARNAMGATEEIVRKIMTNYKVYSLMYNALLEDVDTTVTMEEAAQRTFEYVYQALTEYDEDGNEVDMSAEDQNSYLAVFESIKAAVAEDVSFEEAAQQYGYSVASHPYGAQDDGAFSDIDSIADELALNEVSDVIPVEGGLFLLCLTSEYDEEATENARLTIADEKLAKAFETAYEAMRENVDVELDEALWATANFDRAVAALTSSGN